MHSASVVRLSVVVPAHRAPERLRQVLAALRASVACPVPFELICVDDGSADDDATAAVAGAFADQCVQLAPPARGPAAARNAGAEQAAGDWLLFVDADVLVHPDTLARFWASVERHADAAAIFGAYDDRVQSQPLVSQYRNLMHRYVHLRGAGASETFWAGIGGVRRDRFRAVGGFDARRYPRPSVEDIALGYRLRDAGALIVLDPGIQGTHLKVWSLASMLRTDFADRALPWMHLLLARGGRQRASLNVRAAERWRVALAGMAGLGAAAALGLGRPGAALVLALVLGGVGASHGGLLAYLRRCGGVRLLLAAIPLQVLYYTMNAAAAGLAVLRHLTRRRRAQTASTIFPN